MMMIITAREHCNSTGNQFYNSLVMSPTFQSISQLTYCWWTINLYCLNMTFVGPEAVQ